MLLMPPANHGRAGCSKDGPAGETAAGRGRRRPAPSVGRGSSSPVSPPNRPPRTTARRTAPVAGRGALAAVLGSARPLRERPELARLLPVRQCLGVLPPAGLRPVRRAGGGLGAGGGLTPERGVLPAGAGGLGDVPVGTVRAVRPVREHALDADRLRLVRLVRPDDAVRVGAEQPGAGAPRAEGVAPEPGGPAAVGAGPLVRHQAGRAGGAVQGDGGEARHLRVLARVAGAAGRTVGADGGQHVPVAVRRVAAAHLADRGAVHVGPQDAAHVEDEQRVVVPGAVPRGDDQLVPVPDHAADVGADGAEVGAAGERGDQQHPAVPEMPGVVGVDERDPGEPPVLGGLTGLGVVVRPAGQHDAVLAPPAVLVRVTGGGDGPRSHFRVLASRLSQQ